MQSKLVFELVKLYDYKIEQQKEPQLLSGV